jgi:hypothetical protein
MPKITPSRPRRASSHQSLANTSPRCSQGKSDVELSRFAVVVLMISSKAPLKRAMLQIRIHHRPRRGPRSLTAVNPKELLRVHYLRDAGFAKTPIAWRAAAARPDAETCAPTRPDRCPTSSYPHQYQIEHARAAQGREQESGCLTCRENATPQLTLCPLGQSPGDQR